MKRKFFHIFICLLVSCLEETRCLGYNVISPAESMNNMLKRPLPNHELSLVQSRFEFCFILQSHEQCIKEKLLKKRVRQGNEYFQKYYSKIAKEILFQIEKSKNVIIYKDDYEYFNHIAVHSESLNHIYHLNEWDCDCKLAHFGGYHAHI